MKTRLALCLIPLLITAGLRSEDAANAPSRAIAAEQAEHPTPETVLAAQVSEIAASSGVSQKTKARRIANAVRLAVIAATAEVKDPGQALKIAVGLATVATEAAPHFADPIRNAILSIPSIASIDGALPQVQAAIAAAAEAATGERTVVHFASTPSRPPQNPEFVGGGGDVVVSPSH